MIKNFRETDAKVLHLNELHKVDADEMMRMQKARNNKKRDARSVEIRRIQNENR